MLSNDVSNLLANALTRILVEMTYSARWNVVDGESPRIQPVSPGIEYEEEHRKNTQKQSSSHHLQSYGRIRLEARKQL